MARLSQALVVAGAIGALLLGVMLGAAAVSTVPASGDVTVQTNSGTNVTFQSVSQMPSGNIFIDTDGDGTTDGVITADGSRIGGEDSDVAFDPPLDGSTVTTGSLDTKTGFVFVNATSKQRVEIRDGNLDAFEINGIDYSQGAQDIAFNPSGATGTTEIRLTENPSTDGVKAIEAGSGGLYDYAAVSGSSTTFTFGFNERQIDVVGFSPATPTISNASPTQPVNDDPVTLQADIGDADLVADNVSVTIEHNGTQVSQQWVNGSNATVSHTLNSVTAGPHNWNVTATDLYGNSVTKRYTYGVPDTLFIRNESNASELVDTPTTVEVSFFAENGTVYTRSTTTGSVDMRGLPATESFVVRAQADDYETRTVYLESLIKQQTVYLLPTNATSDTIVFSLDDKTGRFPAGETTLFVEKSINQSGTVEYRTIVSDQFGAANEVVTELETDQRYRLRVQSPTGETRVLGSYTTAGDDSATLTIGQVSFDADDSNGTAFNAEMVETQSGPAVRLTYRDTAAATDDLRVEIYERGDPTAIVRQNTSETFDEAYSETFVLPAQYNSSSALVVRYHANRTSGSDVGDSVNVGSISDLSFGNLDPQVKSLAGWVGIGAVAFFVAPVSGALGGFAAVIMASFLTLVGFLSIPTALLGLAGAAALLFLIGGRD